MNLKYTAKYKNYWIQILNDWIPVKCVRVSWIQEIIKQLFLKAISTKKEGGGGFSCLIETILFDSGHLFESENILNSQDMNILGIQIIQLRSLACLNKLPIGCLIKAAVANLVLHFNLKRCSIFITNCLVLPFNFDAPKS